MRNNSLKRVVSGKKQIQKIVDELIWKHGANVHNWKDWPDILKDEGLTTKDVTPEILEQGLQTGLARHKRKMYQREHPESLFGSEPTSRKKGEKMSESVVNPENPSTMDTDTGATQEKPEREKTVKLPKKDAQKLFKALGEKGADKWNAKILGAKLPKLSKLSKEEWQKVTEPETNDLLSEVLSWLKAGKTIIVVEGEDVATKPKASGSNGTAKKPAAKPTAKAAPKAKPAAGKGKKTEAAKETKSRDGMSALDAAHKVLSDAGEPLGRAELVQRMEKKKLWTSPGGKTPANTIAAAIYVEIKKGGKNSRFKKAGRGLFAAK